MLRYALLVLLAACGASYQTIQIKNATTRPIEELYVYPTGAAKGTSRGQLTPGATTQVKIQGGHVSVTAVSAKIQIDEHTRDRPTASQELELKAPVELVFYDDGSAPPGIERKGTIGVAFQLPSHAPHPDEPTTQPAPEAPQAP
ncbi:MAG TPA: hypothetical protein VLB44_22175 [Kofleriaceae bacterium]|nr:hypothetical protein [Kofleriaceae bacterium]